MSSSLTKHAKPVVHGHHNHVAVGGKDTGVEHVSCAFHVGASVNKQHDWLLPAVTDVCTHTEEEDKKEKVNN